TRGSTPRRSTKHTQVRDAEGRPGRDRRGRDALQRRLHDLEQRRRAAAERRQRVHRRDQGVPRAARRLEPLSTPAGALEERARHPFPTSTHPPCLEVPTMTAPTAPVLLCTQRIEIPTMNAEFVPEQDGGPCTERVV